MKTIYVSIMESLKDSPSTLHGPTGDINMASKAKFTVDDAKELATELHVAFDTFDVDQFLLGLNTELEHGTKKADTNVTDDNQITTAKIALAHLNEIPDYYTRLLKMEADAKKQEKL